jgi:hypothetical protein
VICRALTDGSCARPAVVQYRLGCYREPWRWVVCCAPCLLIVRREAAAMGWTFETREVDARDDGPDIAPAPRPTSIPGLFYPD